MTEREEASPATSEPLTRPVVHDAPEGELEDSLRPQTLVEYVGQQRVTANLAVYLEAARQRRKPLDHMLLYGPPGLGKTSLARIVAHEMGVELRPTSGPTLERPGDLAGLLTNLNPGDVLFIDEIHRLNRTVEEILYAAMEDFVLDLIIDRGPAARSIRMPLPRFTLVGATTRAGLLTAPLRTRFWIQERLEFYSADDLAKIVYRAASILRLTVTHEGVWHIAERARGNPRIANRLLKRVADFAIVENDGCIDAAQAHRALTRLGVDTVGLDQLDRAYLAALGDKFGGGPVGVETLAAALGEERDTLEEMVEPYLLQLGYLQRTPRGRVITPRGRAHVGLPSLGPVTRERSLFPPLS